MIDPKLNDVPAAAADDLDEASERNLTEEQRAQRSRKPRPGLSVKDTIAGDTMLSVGGRGVDTSGVVSGAGAGAGMSSITPTETASGSPAPKVAAGAGATGTTPRGSAGPAQTSTPPSEADAASPTNDEIAARAYECWHERGCPHGSPETDWHRAEQELREKRQVSRATFSAASGGR